MKDSVYSRRDWVSACDFHPISEEEVFAEAFKRIKSSDRPVILLDLDSTLYEVAPRTERILLEWASRPMEDSLLKKVSEQILDPERAPIGYSIKDTLMLLGIEPESSLFEEIHSEMQKFWMDRFFTDDYLEHDRPYEGAALFANQVYELGAEIVYLTGRDSPNMGKGTLTNLKRDGFPIEVARTQLMMKPAFEIDDLDFKKTAVASLSHRGELIASFENEPLNLVAFYGLFPEAMHVFVDTVCSENKAQSCKGLYRIKGYRN